MPKRFHQTAKAIGRRAAYGLVLVLLAVGAMAIQPASRTSEAKAASVSAGRVFEMRIYRVLPGKMPALEARFRDTTAKLLAKHDLKVLGFWVGDDNTFVFLVSHRDREEAKAHWAAMVADPAFQEQVVKPEMADKTVEKVEVTYLQPTDFSPLK